MSECIDSEARDRIAKIWTELREHAVDYWGPDKANGFRSRVHNISARIDVVEGKIKHYEDTRESSCIGKAALEAYLETMERGEAEMKLESAKGKQLMAVQWIQVFGLIVVAIIAALK